MDKYKIKVIIAISIMCAALFADILSFENRHRVENAFKKNRDYIVKEQNRMAKIRDKFESRDRELDAQFDKAFSEGESFLKKEHMHMHEMLQEATQESKRINDAADALFAGANAIMQRIEESFHQRLINTMKNDPIAKQIDMKPLFPEDKNDFWHKSLSFQKRHLNNLNAVVIKGGANEKH